MSDFNAQIAQELAELRTLVQNHKGDLATLDVDKLAARVVEMQNEQTALALAAAERNRPIRRGELIGPPGFQTPSLGVVESGKFVGHRIEDVLFANAFLKRCWQVEPSKVRLPSEEMQGIVKRALSATGSGAGDELVPTGMAASLWEDAFLASKVVALLGRVNMPTDPFDLPLSWGAMTWRKGTQNTVTAAFDPATAKSTLTATEQVLEINWSYDLDEDAVLAVLPSLRADIARSAGEQMDAFVLNADGTNAATGNINLDDADPADDSYYLSLGQDGIRHQYLVDATGQSVDISTTLTDALLRAGIARLGKYGAMTNRLVMFTNPKTYVISLLGLTNVTTYDKFGPQATVLNGQLGSYQGIAVVPSESIALAEDDGKISTTPANNDEGQISLVHRDMWKVGFRRQMLVEVDKDIQKRQFIMVVSFRLAVVARGTRSAQVHTAGIHGITYA